MIKKGCTKYENFMTPGAGGFVLGRGHISHIVGMLYFFKIFYTAEHISDKLPVSIL